jgi:hypothetical protein
VSQVIEDTRRLAETLRDSGVSQDMTDGWARACRDVESPACHHCCHCREAAGERGRPHLRRRPVLDYALLARYRAEGEAAFEPRPRRPRTSPTAIAEATVELIIALRKELDGQGLDAGPQTICWHLEHHHGIRVSAATVSRYLTRYGLVVPEPNKRPKSSYIRFVAELPNERWQSDFIHWRLADGTEVEIVSWLDDHSRLALSIAAHPVTTGEVTLTTFRAAVAAHEYPADQVPEKHARSDAGGFLHLLAEFVVGDGAVIRPRHTFQNRDGGCSPFGKGVRELDRGSAALAISAWLAHIRHDATDSP